VLLALCVGYLAMQVHSLSQRVDGLRAQLGAPAPSGDDAGHPPAGGDTKPADAAKSGHEQRLAKLEAEQKSLRADLRTLEEATADTFAVPDADPKQVLNIVGQEATRIRDRQLDFQRSRWLKWRSATLDQFARAYGLSEEQSSQIDDLLTSETDRLVDVMRQPHAAENPEQVATDWATVLHDTDVAAHGILDPQQIGPWDSARAFERRVLWPWLPEDR